MEPTGTDFRDAIVYALSCFSQEEVTLKAKQEEVLYNLYDGRDVFAWFPTGYGKSLCYQLLPFLFDFKLKRTCSPRVKRSVVIVISPLVSLMVDQVSGLLQRGVSAAILTGNKGTVIFYHSDQHVPMIFIGIHVYK